MAEEGGGGHEPVRLWTTKVPQWEYHLRSPPKCSILPLQSSVLWGIKQQDLEQGAREKHETVSLYRHGSLQRAFAFQTSIE